MNQEAPRPANLETKIYLIRGRKVLLDLHLAELYGVTTSHLNRAVQRNLVRFPEDFMFQLNDTESKSLMCQIGISKGPGRGGRRTHPYAFTQEGVAMLSSVLRSNRAILVNIQIMRTFVKLRELMLDHQELAQKLEALERKYDQNFRTVFEAIREIMSQRQVPRKQIVGLGKPD